MLYNILFATDLCDGLFSIILLISLGQPCLLHEGFFTVLL